MRFIPYLIITGVLTCSSQVPNLGLHSAAATGNVGLVEYALSNGQPVNSVLDGVLPLHAACAGGNEQVVKVLLDHGADVNAPRYDYKPHSTPKPLIGDIGYLENTPMSAIGMVPRP